MSDKTQYIFEPKSDITAYELAKCVQMLFPPLKGVGMQQRLFAEADESVRRHFRKVSS